MEQVDPLKAKANSGICAQSDNLFTLATNKSKNHQKAC